MQVHVWKCYVVVFAPSEWEGSLDIADQTLLEAGLPVVFQPAFLSGMQCVKEDNLGPKRQTVGDRWKEHTGFVQNSADLALFVFWFYLLPAVGFWASYFSVNLTSPGLSFHIYKYRGVGCVCNNIFITGQV